jgi:hypothetical protein
MFVEEKGPAVLAGVGKGCGFVAEVADCERDCDMAAEDGLLSECAAALLMAGPPLACELIEG